MAPPGSRPVVVNQQNKVEINQANSNTSQGLANSVGAATSSAATDAMDKFARDLQFGMAGGDGR